MKIMSRLLLIPFWGSIVFFSFMIPSYASVDEMQLTLLNQYELPLRWDNIEGGEQFISGPAPRYNSKYDMHMIHLDPGMEIKIKIPERKMLRIISSDRNHTLDPLKISTSNGTGLHAFLPFPMSPDKLSGLIIPDTDDPAICKIFLPENGEAPIDIALFLSRQETLGALAPSRTLLPLEGKSVCVRQDETARAERFWRLTTGRPGRLSVKGPARITIENRLLYSNLEPSRRIRYCLKVLMNGQVHTALNFETVPEISKLLFIDNKHSVWGRSKSSYLNIPNGDHTIDILSNSDVILRIMKQDVSGYLFAEFNSPESYQTSMEKVFSQNLVYTPPDKISDVIKSNQTSLSEMETISQQMVRDNRRPQSGLSGAFLMEQQAKKRPDAPQIKRVATDLYDAHTFFRNLLPTIKPDNGSQKNIRFILPRLKRSGDSHMVVAQQHADSLYSMVQEGSFLNIPHDEFHPLVYTIPGRVAPSTLRIILPPQDSPGNFFIKFNNKSPLQFTVESDYELPQDQFRVTPAEAGLALHQISQQSSEPSLAPGTYIKPIFFELALPPEVDGFILWGEESFKGMAAVQYLDSLTYQMSEPEYLQALKIEGSPHRLFSEFATQLSSGQVPVLNDVNAISEGIELNNLKSSWTSLIRKIRSDYSVFSAPQNSPLPDPLAMLSKNQIDKSIKRAQYLEDHNQPLPALEKWSELFHNTTGSVHNTASFKMVDQLIALGETYLAESFLKQVFLKSEKNVSDQAFERLVSFYQEGGSNSQLTSLYSARAVMYPTPDHILDLSEQLLEEGSFLNALMLASLLPSSMKATTTLLKAADVLGWFKVSEDLIHRLSDPEEKAYWNSLGLLYQSKYNKALETLGSAREQGNLLKTAVEEGLKIKEKLLSNDENQIIQGILEWESWYSNLPVDYYWQNESNSVVDYDGSVTLYNPPRDLYSTAFRATPSTPVKAKFYGPLKLKVSVRVLHEPQDKLPVNGWFNIRNNHENHMVPIVNNLPVQGMVIPGKDTLKPGRSISYEITLDPGVNEIEVYSPTISLVAMFQTLRPGIPLTGILPELTMASVEAILSGDVWPTPPLLTQNRYHCILNDCLKIIAPDHGLQFIDMEQFRNFQTPHSVKKATASWGELENRRHQKRLHEQQMTSPKWLSLDNKDNIFKKMSQLALAADENSDNILQIEIEARQLFSKYPHITGLKSLLEQITQKTTWEPAAMIEANAGIQLIPITKWQPESGSLRIRKALLPDFPFQEQVVSRENDLVFFMNNTDPITLKAEISLLDLPILQKVPIKFFYQLDKQPLKYVEIFPEFPTYHLAETIAKGQHRLVIGIMDSYANQFLKVKFCEATSIKGKCSDIQLDKLPTRSFYTATHEDPAKIQILGPAWVRIDTLKHNDTWVSYHSIDAGWQTLLLKPDKNETESLFRVSRRELKQSPSEQKSVRPVTVKFDQVPAPYTNFESAPSMKNVWFKDVYPLGSQEDGTWSMIMSYKDPFQTTEDKQEGELGHFYEFLTTHHYYSETLPGYFDTSFLSRFRHQAGPTIGILEDFYYYPERFPIGLNLDARFYLQKPNADNYSFFENSSTEYSGLLKARLFQKRPVGLKFFHIPSFSIFGRVLSMNDQNEYPTYLVDRDIFSSYKNDHKAGITISDYAGYKPWLDTEWFLQGSINSNEDLNLFNPDNIKMQIGWKQLLGNLQANLKYEQRYYFSDSDRQSDVTRNIINLELSWNQWMLDQQRFKLALDLEQDLDDSENAVLFSVSWFFSNGRGLKDIRPGALDFYEIHKRNTPFNKNNSIEND